MDDIFTKLAAPFHLEDLEWRAGATNADKTRALALAYITSRAAMDRLDEVVGPPNWRDDFKPGPDGGLICGISLRIDGEWITKWDGADNTTFEPIKGGLSDAFKRAAVKWGIGRYLYRLPNEWVPCEIQGKSVVLKAHPSLPSWAVPMSGAHPTPDKDASSESSTSNVWKPQYPEGENRPEKTNGKRSWDAAIVDAILEAGLAKDALSALDLLNGSNLAKDASPEEALAWARAQA